MIVLNQDSLRIEKKYKVFLKDISKLYGFIYRSSIFTSAYKIRNVGSLYFDTPSYDFAMSNMSGYSQRVKLRYRWYGECRARILNNFIAPGSNYRLELKRKSNSMSDKLILHEFFGDSGLEHQQLIKFMTGYVNGNAARNEFIKLGELHPSVLISYDREYFEAFGSPDIRLTIDSNIRYTFPYNFQASGLLSKDFVIVELKFPPSKQKIVEEIASAFGFRVVRFSKYVAGLSKLKNFSY